MEGYLRGYYGYKNFGDELLFFWASKRLFAKYPLTKLFVEVGDKWWMDDRVRENYQWLLSEKELKNITFVNAKQHRYKFITHLVNFLGRGKYKKTFKFFGWWEVLSDERHFPHDGRNIPLLFNYSVKKWKFILMGGIGKPNKSWTKKLYSYILPKAEKILVRDKDSLEVAKKLNPENTVLYQDFAQEIIMNAECRMQTCLPVGKDSENKKYILININKQSVDKKHIHKIITFCLQYPDHKKIFFPCDMNDDQFCFSHIKKYVPGLEMYDWTKKPLEESLSLFYYADGGIWARLHFLLPLKIYNKPIVAIPYADKINKLINSGTRK